MVLKTASLLLVKQAFVLGLLLLLVGIVVNLLSDEKSSIGLLLTSLGWLSSLASGVVLSTKRVRCPSCKERWIPLSRHMKERKPCTFCTN